MDEQSALNAHFQDVRDRLARIETLLQTTSSTLSDARERIAEAEGWRKAHMQAHEDETKHRRWELGLITSALLASLGTITVVLLH